MTLLNRQESNNGEIAHQAIIAEIELEEVERLARFVVPLQASLESLPVQRIGSPVVSEYPQCAHPTSPASAEAVTAVPPQSYGLTVVKWLHRS